MTSIHESQRWRVVLPHTESDQDYSMAIGPAWMPSLRAATLLPAQDQADYPLSAVDLALTVTYQADGGVLLTPASTPGVWAIGTRWMLLALLLQRARQLPTPQRQAGQALVEFALIVPILLALVLTFIGLWPVLNAHDAVAVATAAGAHEAAITGGNMEATKARVTENLQAAGLGLYAQAELTVSCGPCPRYQPVTVAVRVPVEPWISLPWLDESYTVDATITRASEIDGGAVGTGDGGIRLPGGGGSGTPGLPGIPGPGLPGGTK